MRSVAYKLELLVALLWLYCVLTVRHMFILYVRKCLVTRLIM